VLGHEGGGGGCLFTNTSVLCRTEVFVNKPKSVLISTANSYIPVSTMISLSLLLQGFKNLPSISKPILAYLSQIPRMTLIGSQY